MLAERFAVRIMDSGSLGYEDGRWELALLLVP
jgi:hypothetical protein